MADTTNLTEGTDVPDQSIDNGDTVMQDQQNQESNNETNESLVDIKELKKLQEQKEKVSKNFDRVNTELQKIKKDLESERKKNMSTKELEELKHREYEENLKKLEDDLNNKTLAFEKTKIINEQKWDEEFLTIVKGDDVDEFKLNVIKLSEKFETMVEEKVNEKLAQGNPVPKKGIAVDEDLFTLDEIKAMKTYELQKNHDKVMKSMKNIEKNQ